MDNPAPLNQQIAQRIKEANNVLVTVNSSPSVDQLAATIGLTLLLNKLGKHGTAVFSGAIPSTIEFLEPEKTLEKNTDSLRDFIIALDKSKADKLRYKVEDKLVKIFITPYRTSLTDKDLEFSQGDFNVDVVIALGVKQREQLDQAIVSHGRILHDATVISINTDVSGDIGTMNWVDNKASSLCEMVMSLVDLMQDAKLLDGQMATALLTGIVAQTDRFSNSKTSPTTMSLSSKLMAAGANQQLIATKLQDELKPAVTSATENDAVPPSSSPDGSLSIDHEGNVIPDAKISHDDDLPEDGDQIHIDEHGTLVPKSEVPSTKLDETLPPSSGTGPHVVLNPPALGGTLTANSHPEGLDPSTDPMTLPAVEPPLLDHSAPAASTRTFENPFLAPPAKNLTLPPEQVPDKPVVTVDEPQTLSDLEAFVDSPHAGKKSEQTGSSTTVSDTSLDEARSAVTQAIGSSPTTALEPVAALNAQPIELNKTQEKSQTDHGTNAVPQMTVDEATGMPNFDMPANLVPNTQPTDATKSSVTDPTAPPPVPPPMMPPAFGGAPVSDSQTPIVPPVL